jgi:uncharacterized membrane protein
MPNPWDRQPRQTFSLPADAALDCPVCGQPTDSLKQYRFVGWVVFYLFGAIWQTAFYRGCPRCVRGMIGRRMAWNLVPANLLWFLLVLPWGLGLIAASFRKGHSAAVLRGVTPELAAYRESQQIAAANEVSWPRVWAIVGLLFGLFPGVGLVLALIAWLTTRKQVGWVRAAGRIALGLSLLAHLALAVGIVGAELGWWR